MILSALCTGAHPHAQDIDADADVRANPELEQLEAIGTDINLSAYEFLNLSENTINLNGADWTTLKPLFEACGDTVISIVHIGDSHIQAEGSTSTTRSLLQQAYGSAGRGLILPFRLAGTNQPTDYSITSPSRFTPAKLIKQPWPVDMGFTGLALQPVSTRFSFTITVSRRPGSEPDFDMVRIFTQGKMPRLVAVKDEKGFDTLFSAYADGDTLEVMIPESGSKFTFEFESLGRCQILGFMLENQMTGVLYSAIGHNGATYSSYNTLGDVGAGIKALNPDIVIISLGTNEAFGRTTPETLYANIDALVSSVKRHNPHARILLTTPAECQRSKWVRSGKKKRRSRTFSVNTKVAEMRNSILAYGKDKGIATYDFYSVAGGQGASDKWLKAKLLSKDRIHNTWDGYALSGTLLYIALQNAINHKTTD